MTHVKSELYRARGMGFMVHVQVGSHRMEGQAATSSDAEALRDKWERLLWAAENSRSCPNCSRELTASVCKRRCERCGYFEDCSEGNT